MPPKPPPWDLTKEEMDAILASLSSLESRIAALKASIDEELAGVDVWRSDVDNQLGMQFSRLDGLDAADAALRQRDTQHDTSIANLVSADTAIRADVVKQAARVDALYVWKPTVDQATANLANRVSATDAALVALRAIDNTIDTRLDALEARPVPEPPVDYQPQLTALTNALDALTGRVAKLEEPPIEGN